MVDKEILAGILLENRNIVQSIKLIKRNFAFNHEFRNVLVGVRRAGKSFLLFQRMQELLSSGHTWNKMLYLNFEDDRLLGFDTLDFQTILEVHENMGGEKPILFLDEVQNIPGWEKFARRMADQKYVVNITGSNAKMLSSDVATTLGGRYRVETVFPYDFRDFLMANAMDSDDMYFLPEKDREHYADEYLRFGGFPECASLPGKQEYLRSVYEKIYFGDIAARHNVENKVALRLLFQKMAESVMQSVSLTRLANVLTTTGAKVSKNTILNYAEYAKDAFLILPLKNFADHFTERETNKKYYFVDNGIISLLTFNKRAALLENMVAVTMLRKFGMDDNVFFYHYNVKVDFVVPEKELAVQACYELGDEGGDTFHRETKALVKLAKRLPYRDLVIVTYNEEREITVDGIYIRVMPLWKWLLEQ